MATPEEIAEIAKKLTTEQLDILVEFARSLTRDVVHFINDESDIMTTPFVEEFSNRLRFYHATQAEKMNKKAFEFAFLEASKKAGRKSELIGDPTNPGIDIVVDGVGFSMKTEAAESIKPEEIHISKLMEARWIRDCENREDFAKEVREKVGGHLRRYQRILMLRAFDTLKGYKYDLVEIPRDLLLQVENLESNDFQKRRESGSSRADVTRSGNRAFTVRLDGSVEKITITGLLMSLCDLHGSWVVPISHE